MTTPLATLLAAVPSLNDEAEPFVFTVEGDSIIGRWNIVHAQFVGLDLTAGTIDKNFEIVVELNAKNSTYDFTENHSETRSGAGIGTDGTISFGGSKTVFTGKSTSKSFSFDLGNVTKTESGVSPVLSYSFSTARIKDPLFGFLADNGWSRKKGFFSGLFNR